MKRAYVDAPHGQMHARLSSPGAPPALVLLPQTPSTSEMFESVVARLDDLGPAAAVDLPGFGGSDALPGAPTVGAWADAVLAALDALGATTFALVGHHAGASVAAELAVRAPERVRRLVLAAPPLVDPAELERRVPEVAGLARDGAHVLAAWRRAGAKEPTASPELRHRETVAALASSSHHAAAYAAVLAHDLAGALARLRVPTLVTTGPEDPLAPAAELAAARVHAARFEPLPLGGAYVFDRHPDVVARVLRRFLVQGDP